LLAGTGAKLHEMKRGGAFSKKGLCFIRRCQARRTCLSFCCVLILRRNEMAMDHQRGAPPSAQHPPCNIPVLGTWQHFMVTPDVWIDSPFDASKCISSSGSPESEAMNLKVRGIVTNFVALQRANMNTQTERTAPKPNYLGRPSACAPERLLPSNDGLHPPSEPPPT
jgi:hypothetical protein